MHTENKFITVFSYAVLTVIALTCVIPFVMIISASFSNETSLIANGYSLLPQDFTLSAYRIIAENSNELTRSYMVTIVTTVIGTVLSVVMIVMTAYPLSRTDYPWRKGVNFYLYFTQLFSGGLVPAYLINTQYLHLKNNPLVLIVPGLMSVWNVFLMRTYFRQVNVSLIEAPKLDGASEWTILFKIVCPIAKTGIATITFMVALSYWNEWYTCLLYMTNEEYITLQYFLQKIMTNINAILKDTSMFTAEEIESLPSETARMALCVFVAGPMMCIFPFFQKYFIRGVALGSVK